MTVVWSCSFLDAYTIEWFFDWSKSWTQLYSFPGTARPQGEDGGYDHVLWPCSVTGGDSIIESRNSIPRYIKEKAFQPTEQRRTCNIKLGPGTYPAFIC